MFTGERLKRHWTIPIWQYKSQSFSFCNIKKNLAFRSYALWLFYLRKSSSGNVAFITSNQMGRVFTQLSVYFGCTCTYFISLFHSLLLVITDARSCLIRLKDRCHSLIGQWMLLLDASNWVFAMFWFPQKYLVNYLILASSTVATKPQPRSHIRTEIEKRIRCWFSARTVVQSSLWVSVFVQPFLWTYVFAMRLQYKIDWMVS